MFQFDPDKLRVELVQLKSVTGALGGSISVVDQARSSEKKEVLKRIPIPTAVARSFRERHKTSKYINPVWTAVVLYGDHVVALERHPLGVIGSATTTTADGKTRMWIPDCQQNLDKYVIDVVESSARQWYFDGRYVYAFRSADLATAVVHGEPLSSDHRFRSIEVDAIPLHQLDDASKLELNDRTCVAYIAGNGDFAVSPPIWKDVTAIGKRAKKGDEEDQTSFTFDGIDEYLSVNLAFALTAAKGLSNHWGFDVIEALNLPQLMIKLKTVNLPGIPAPIKATYDCGMSFQHAFAWLCGFQHKATTLEEHLVVRSLMKYLTTSGLFYSQMFDAAAVYRPGKTGEDVPVLTKDQALENFAKLSSGDILAVVQAKRNSKKQRRQRNHAHSQPVGGIMRGDNE